MNTATEGITFSALEIHKAHSCHSRHAERQSIKPHIAVLPPHRPDNTENARYRGGFVPEQQTFLSLITGSFATPAAENPTVAMIEAAYEHHHINARYGCSKLTEVQRPGQPRGC
jgi:hypothetical protein